MLDFIALMLVVWMVRGAWFRLMRAVEQPKVMEYPYTKTVTTWYPNGDSVSVKTVSHEPIA